jgi:hypothetical protein
MKDGISDWIMIILDPYVMIVTTKDINGLKEE